MNYLNQEMGFVDGMANVKIIVRTANTLFVFSVLKYHRIDL